MQPLPQRLDGHRAPEQGALPQRAAVALQKRPLAMPMMVGAMSASVRWMPMLRTKLWSILSWSSGSSVRVCSKFFEVAQVLCRDGARHGAQWIARQGTCLQGWSDIGPMNLEFWRPGCSHGHEPMRRTRSFRSSRLHSNAIPEKTLKRLAGQRDVLPTCNAGACASLSPARPSTCVRRNCSSCTQHQSDDSVVQVRKRASWFSSLRRPGRTRSHR